MQENNNIHKKNNSIQKSKIKVSDSLEFNDLEDISFLLNASPYIQNDILEHTPNATEHNVIDNNEFQYLLNKYYQNKAKKYKVKIKKFQEIGSGLEGKVYQVDYDINEYKDINNSKSEIRTKSKSIVIKKEENFREKITIEHNDEAIKLVNQYTKDNPYSYFIKSKQDFLDENGYEIYKLYKGGDLKKYSQINKISPNNIFELINGFAQLHSMGVVHRDIKPENIFVQTEFDKILKKHGIEKQNIRGKFNESFKIGDFGLLQYAKNNNIERYVGTKGYIAPELKNATEEYNFDNLQKADAWSLGVTLFNIIFKENFSSLKLIDGQDKIDNYIDNAKNLNIDFCGFDENEKEQLTNFIKKILKDLLIIDPNERKTPADILTYTYKIKGKTINPFENIEKIKTRFNNKENGKRPNNSDSMYKPLSNLSLPNLNLKNDFQEYVRTNHIEGKTNNDLVNTKYRRSEVKLPIFNNDFNKKFKKQESDKKRLYQIK